MRMIYFIRFLVGVYLIEDLDRLHIRGGQGYTDGRVKCRKPVEEPGTAPRVRIGNFRCLIDWVKSSNVISWNSATCETVNKSSKSDPAT